MIFFCWVNWENVAGALVGFFVVGFCYFRLLQNAEKINLELRVCDALLENLGCDL